MSDGLNRATLLGNLGAEPELRFTQNGGAVLNLRLATTTSYLDRDKQRQERTDWHAVVVWGKRAEALAKILTKGSRLYVEGSIQTSSYEKNGEKRYKTEINASEIILAGGPKADSAQPHTAQPASRYGQSGGGPAKHSAPVDDYDGSDIPFARAMTCAEWDRP